MAVLAWTMTGLALWHFTIFLPDHFWGGIVGAFLGALFGAIAFGLLVNGLGVPARDETDVLTALQAAPGALLGMGLVYLRGLRQERAAG
jgi:hypothetical protein